jgi:undecaprenyl-diphosphatase
MVIILAGLFLLFHHEVLQAENPYRVFMEKKIEILKVFFSGAVAWAVAEILKILIHIPRPFVALQNIYNLFPETNYTFPSVHTALFSALAFSIFFLHKKAGYIFMFFALLIGIARIVAGVHFPVDILGGFILGALVSYLFAFFAKSV